MANRDFTKFPENLTDSHGSPKDRGSADRYYWREKVPHYYPNGTGNSPMFDAKDMTVEEIAAYNRAWEEETDRKDYG